MWPYIVAGAAIGLALTSSDEGAESADGDAVEDSATESSSEHREQTGGGSDEGVPSRKGPASERPTTPADDPGPAPDDGAERKALEAGSAARERWEQETARAGVGTESAKTREEPGSAQVSEAESTQQE